MLKDGETDIDSSEIWRFASHSDYKNYKVGETGSVTIVLLAGTGSKVGFISHNLGYIPVFFAYIEHEGKGYLVAGSNNNPRISVPTGGGSTLISFSVEATSTALNIVARASIAGNPTSNETFIVRVFFIADEII